MKKQICPLTGKPCEFNKTMHVTEKKKNGKIISFDLCEDNKGCGCNYADNLSKEDTKLASIFDIEFNFLSSLLNKLFPKKAPIVQVSAPQKDVLQASVTIPKFIQMAIEEQKKREIKCACGMTLYDLQHSSRLGCEYCFTTFAQYLNPVIQSCQGSLQHVGKVPKQKVNSYLKTQIASLEFKLKDAIEKEKYEEAAVIKDQLEISKKKLNELHPKTSEDQ